MNPTRRTFLKAMGAGLVLASTRTIIDLHTNRVAMLGYRDTRLPGIDFRIPGDNNDPRQITLYSQLPNGDVVWCGCGWNPSLNWQETQPQTIIIDTELSRHLQQHIPGQQLAPWALRRLRGKA